VSPDVVSVLESTAENSSPTNISAQSSTDDSNIPVSRAIEEPHSSALSLASKITQAIEPSAPSTGAQPEVVSTSVYDTVSAVSRAVEEPLSSALSVESDSTDAIEPSTGTPLEIVPTSVHDPPSALGTPADETVPSEAINSSLPKEDGDAGDDTDLQAFLADIGLDDSPEPQPSEIVESTPPRVGETEEEKAQRLLERQQMLALRRMDIMRRHSNWETQLETLVKTRRKELRKALVAIRKAAVDELKESSQIKGHVDSFLAEAEKYLKGVEMSFTSLKRENKRNEDKRLLWLRVVRKVEEKFVLKTRETETAVNEWYSGVLAKEMSEVSDCSGFVIPETNFGSQ
jgi:hypothetical protein